MADPTAPPSPPLPKQEGTWLRQAISREVARALKEYFGRGPLKAKTYLMDDICLVVMRDVLIPAEETMLKAGDEQAVRNFRLAYQEHVKDKLVGIVEQLTDRKVATYQSQILFDPDMLMEVFVFEGGPLDESAS